MSAIKPILGMVVIIALGLALKHKYFPRKEDVQPDDIENVPVSEWRKTLIGTWDFHGSGDKSGDVMVIKGPITFKPDNSFIMNVSTTTYYAKNRNPESPGEVQTGFVSGGNVQGKWKIVDSAVQLSDLECNASFGAKEVLSRQSGTHKEPHFGPYEETFNQELLRKILNRRFGKEKGPAYETFVKTFSEDLIQIWGWDYDRNSDIEYSFRKPDAD